MTEGGGFFRGTSKDQDLRFTDKEKQLLKSLKFPPEYDVKIDTKKIKLDVMKPWISEKVSQLLGFEDEVLIGYVIGLLEEKQFPDPKVMQINLTGFLDTDSAEFTRELWKLLISAQNNIAGIPQEFLEKKKEEIKQRKAEQERIKLVLEQRLAEINTQTNGEIRKHDIKKEERKEEDKRSDRKDDRDRRDDRHRSDRDRRSSRDDRHRSSRDDRDDRRDRDKRRRDDSSERRRSRSGSPRRRSSREKRRRHSRSRSHSKSRSRSRSQEREKRRSDRSERSEKSDRAEENGHKSKDNGDEDERVRKERELREKALASIKKD